MTAMERAQSNRRATVLSIQVQWERVPELDEIRTKYLLTSVASRTGLAKHFEAMEASDEGHYTNFTYVTDDPPSLWSLLKQEILEAPTIGPMLRRASIVVCQGEDGWDDYLLLHHYDENEPLHPGL